MSSETDGVADLRLRRLEASCARDPKRFARITGTAALLVVLVFVGVLLLALTVAWHLLSELASGSQIDFLAFGLLLLCSYIVGTGLGALRPTGDEAHGIALTRQEVPKLFQLLDKLARKTGLRVPDTVILSGERPLSVAPRARLGFVGAHSYTLVASLPALMSLDAKQFAAMVGRELSRSMDSRHALSTWIQCMRKTWAEMALPVCSDRPWQRAWAITNLGLAGWFLLLFFPWFKKRALILARHQGFSADYLACCLAGSQSAVDAIVRLEVQRLFLEQAFWPDVLRRAGHSPKPDVSPYRSMGPCLRCVRSHHKAHQWLAMSLQRYRSSNDEEPCLRDRLSRAKLAARLTQPPEQSAAQLLLQDSLAPLIERLDALWRDRIRGQWTQLRDEYLVQQRLERELQAAGDRGQLHADDHLLWAHAARRVYGDDAYEALLRMMLVDHPNDPHARYELGALLLEQDSTGAIAHGSDLLRKLAFEQTSSQSLAAAQRYGQWLQLQGRSDEAAFWADEVRRLRHLALEAQVACHDFNQVQRFTGPDLSERHLKRVRKLLARQQGIGKTYLVGKHSSEFRGWRFAVLLIESQPPSKRAAKKMSDLMTSLKLPILFTVIDASDPAWLTAPRKAIVEKIRSTADALVIQRDSQTPSRDSINNSPLSVLPGASPT